MLVEVVGYTASVVAIGMYVPQVVQSWRTKQMDGISSATFFLISLNSILWLSYGLLIKSIPLVFTNGVILVLTITILALKKKYG